MSRHRQALHERPQPGRPAARGVSLLRSRGLHRAAGRRGDPQTQARGMGRLLRPAVRGAGRFPDGSRGSAARGARAASDALFARHQYLQLRPQEPSCVREGAFRRGRAGGAGHLDGGPRRAPLRRGASSQGRRHPREIADLIVAARPSSPGTRTPRTTMATSEPHSSAAARPRRHGPDDRRPRPQPGWRRWSATTSVTSRGWRGCSPQTGRESLVSISPGRSAASSRRSSRSSRRTACRSPRAALRRAS